MKLKNRILNILIPSRWGIWLAIKDIQNYRSWIQTIDIEKQNKNSIFNKWAMKHNFFYVLYFTISLPEEDRVLPDNIKRLRVVETLAPVHRYIDEELQFAEYIVPEFNQFFDEENKPTMVYGIVYKFAFKKISIKWFFYNLIILGGLTWMILKFQILQYLINLI